MSALPAEEHVPGSLLLGEIRTRLGRIETPPERERWRSDGLDAVDCGGCDIPCDLANAFDLGHCDLGHCDVGGCDAPGCDL